MAQCAHARIENFQARYEDTREDAHAYTTENEKLPENFVLLLEMGAGHRDAQHVW